jgi:hypothetical protein
MHGVRGRLIDEVVADFGLAVCVRLLQKDAIMKSALLGLIGVVACLAVAPAPPARCSIAPAESLASVTGGAFCFIPVGVIPNAASVFQTAMVVM